MRARVLLAACLATALLVLSYAVFAPTGMPRLQRMRDEAQTLDGQVKAARAENGRIADDIRVLRGDDKGSRPVLDKLVREELGYVGKNEIVMTGVPAPELVPLSASTHASTNASTPSTTTPPAQAPAVP